MKEDREGKLGAFLDLVAKECNEICDKRLSHIEMDLQSLTAKVEKYKSAVNRGNVTIARGNELMDRVNQELKDTKEELNSVLAQKEIDIKEIKASLFDTLTKGGSH